MGLLAPGWESKDIQPTHHFRIRDSTFYFIADDILFLLPFLTNISWHSSSPPIGETKALHMAEQSRLELKS